MKKAVKTLFCILIFGAAIPALAGLAIQVLWNAILIPACGFSAITFLQGAGLFILGQILSTGFVIGLFALGGSIHSLTHHGSRRRAMHDHWHNMSQREREEFIRRRREYFGFNQQKRAESDGAN